MKTFTLFAMMIVPSLVLAADEKTVFIPRDTTPFTIDEGNVVRLSGKGIAGAQITATVTGPAKAQGYHVAELVKGKRLIGPGNMDFIVMPTGKGKVTVEIKSVPPNGGNATVAKYEFEVK